MALQLRRKTHESIVYIDNDSAPRIMLFGEDFLLEDLPVGTRVIYPKPPIEGLPNPRRRSATRSTTRSRWSRCTRCSSRG